jgi:hypothetical protein
MAISYYESYEGAISREEKEERLQGNPLQPFKYLTTGLLM